MRTALAAATIAVAVLVGTASSEPEIRAQGTGVEGKQPRAVVSRDRLYPDRYKRRVVRFEPYAHPNEAQVKRIIRYEASRWGVSPWSVGRRISCESGFRWWVVNSGGYGGLGQFAASTFWRGVSTMPRGVKVKLSRLVHRPTIKVVRFNDGTTKRHRGFPVRVRRTRIYRGRLRPTTRLHGWSQVRIVAQAIAGRSAVSSSEWACPA